MADVSDISAMADVQKDQQPQEKPPQDIDYKSQYENLSKQFAEIQSKQVEAERKAAEKERAQKEKSGKFEELYNEQKKAFQEQAEKFKKTQIENELKLAAKDNGLKKLEYLAMLDRDGLDISEDGSILGLTEKITAFKTKYPEFFDDGLNAHNNEERGNKVPYTDNRQISTSKRVNYNTVEELKEKLPSLKGKEYRRALGEVAKSSLSKHLFDKRR